MCTVSWLFSNHGYELFFNRDELKSRQRATRPSLKTLHQTQIISPIDTDAGGTWITVNEHGLSLCLLNHYAAQQVIDQRDWISRGLLVQALSHFADTSMLLSQLKAIKLSHYRPFDLLALSPNNQVWQAHWDGFELQIKQPTLMPLTSSSYATDKVISCRLKHFRNIQKEQPLNPTQLRQYHASHSPEAGAFSVCMHRDNGQTVSFSHIRVDQSQVYFDYYDGSPCSTGEVHKTRLARLSVAPPSEA